MTTDSGCRTPDSGLRAEKVRGNTLESGSGGLDDVAMHNHQKLDVWRRSYELAKSVYRSARHFPSDERFGLVAQMKRSSASIPSNIAEGSAQDSAKAFAHSLRIALGSAFELETQISLASDLQYVRGAESRELRFEVDGVKRMLISLIRTVRKQGESKA